MKKVIFAMILMAFGTLASASDMTCNLTEDGNFIASEKATLDESGYAELNPIQHDIFWFGATAEEGAIAAVWAMWENNELKKLGSELDLEVETPAGTILKMACNIE